MMTVAEFENSITGFYGLIDFCNDNGCGYCEDICDDDVRDDSIYEDAKYQLENYNWRDVLSFLGGLDDCRYDWWRKNDLGEWVALDDDDFYERRDEVLQWAIEHEIVEQDADEEEEDAFFADTPQEPAEEEFEYEAPDFEVDELFSNSSESFAEACAAAQINADAALAAEIAAAEYHDACVKAEFEAQAAAERAEREALDADFGAFMSSLAMANVSV